MVSVHVIVTLVFQVTTVDRCTFDVRDSCPSVEREWSGMEQPQTGSPFVQSTLGMVISFDSTNDIRGWALFKEHPGPG